MYSSQQCCLCLCKGLDHCITMYTLGLPGHQQVYFLQVMYVTATSPYLFMLALLIRNCLLPGAREGILFYLTPDWSRLNDLEVNLQNSVFLHAEIWNSVFFLSFLIRSCMWLPPRHICSCWRCLSEIVFCRGQEKASSSI